VHGANSWLFADYLKKFKKHVYIQQILQITRCLKFWNLSIWHQT